MCAVYTQEDQYSEIEALYVSMFKNEKLAPERRHRAALNIFGLPSYYKPKF